MKALEGVIEFGALAAVALIAFVVLQKVSAQAAQANAALTAQRGYTSLEVQAGTDILNAIFHRQQSQESGT